MIQALERSRVASIACHCSPRIAIPRKTCGCCMPNLVRRHRCHHDLDICRCQIDCLVASGFPPFLTCNEVPRSALFDPFLRLSLRLRAYRNAPSEDTAPRGDGYDRSLVVPRPEIGLLLSGVSFRSALGISSSQDRNFGPSGTAYAVHKSARVLRLPVHRSMEQGPQEPVLAQSIR